MQVKMNTMGLQMFLPMSILGGAVLIPINWYGNQVSAKRVFDQYKQEGASLPCGVENWLRTRQPWSTLNSKKTFLLFDSSVRPLRVATSTEARWTPKNPVT